MFQRSVIEMPSGAEFLHSLVFSGSRFTISVKYVNADIYFDTIIQKKFSFLKNSATV